MPPACAVNARFLHQPVTGMQRYAREIISRLRGHPRLIVPSQPLGGLSAQWWEQITLPHLLDPGELLWSPAGTGPLSVSRQVLTLHDLDPLDHPRSYPLGMRTWLRALLPNLIRTARAVILPSETQRRQFLDRFRLPPERVFAVPCGVDLQRFHPALTESIIQVRRRCDLPSDYFLMAGNFESAWNLDRLLQAWREIRSQYRRLSLAVIDMEVPRGADGQPRRTPGVQFLGRVEERDLPALYSGALAAVFPAAGPGSSLTLLEAMACGVPVIAAGGSVLAEMVGDAGLLVAPGPVENILAGAMQVASSARLQADLCCRGLERARLFTWDRSARQVFSILKSVG